MVFKNKIVGFEIVFLIIIIILGIILRIIFYSYDRPFWNDECALALNIVDYNFLNYFKPLNYGQAAPPFFLIISALFSKIIPGDALSLRFLPLISSILSIFVFYFLSKNILKRKASVIFALILFCFNYQLLYYAQEFKQYSSDVLIFITILNSYFYIKLDNYDTKKLLIMGSAYALAIWLSFTSLFAIFAVLCVLFLKNIKDYKKILLLFFPVIISFLLFYISQSHLSSSKFLHDYWSDGFINKNFNNFFSVFLQFFIFGFNNLFLLLFFVIGLISNLFTAKNQKSSLIFIPLFVAILLSYFSIYPLSSRVSLYLIPIFILFIAKTIDAVTFKNKVINYGICLIIISVGVSFPIINSIYKIGLKKFDYENIIAPLQMAKEKMAPDDILYISDGAGISYQYYKNRFNFKNIIIEKKRIKNQNDYVYFLDNNLDNGKTYYYIFSHFPNKRERLNNVYLWAKGKQNFKIYADKYANALIVFTQ